MLGKMPIQTYMSSQVLVDGLSSKKQVYTVCGKIRGEAFIEQNMFWFVDWNTKKNLCHMFVFVSIYSHSITDNNCWDANLQKMATMATQWKLQNDQ